MIRLVVQVLDGISGFAGTSSTDPQDFSMAPVKLRGLHGASEDSEAALLADLDIRKGPKGFGLQVGCRAVEFGSLGRPKT